LSTRNFTRYLPGRSSSVPSNLHTSNTTCMRDCQHTNTQPHISAA
jgi:hypothetical protein